MADFSPLGGLPQELGNGVPTWPWFRVFSRQCQSQSTGDACISEQMPSLVQRKKQSCAVNTSGSKIFAGLGEHSAHAKPPEKVQHLPLCDSCPKPARGNRGAALSPACAQQHLTFLHPCAFWGRLHTQ
uniref:Uncharacterized protein n=1 Tax=Sphaerodactylus townsendi TaxID=933632 RepID=A0ACB8EFF5_9SAUR